MAENMPILYQNIMYGLPSDYARQVFLWAVERPGEDRMCYRAEAFAREANALNGVLRQMFGLTNVMTRDQTEDLLKFTAIRHANYRYGGNLKPGYAA